LITHQRYCELDCVISTLHLLDGNHQQKDVVKLLSEELGDSSTKSMWKDCIDKAISHCFNYIAVVNYTKQPKRVEDDPTKLCFFSQPSEESTSRSYRPRRVDCAQCSDRNSTKRCQTSTFCSGCNKFLCKKCFGPFHERYRKQVLEQRRDSYTELPVVNGCKSIEIPCVPVLTELKSVTVARTPVFRGCDIIGDPISEPPGPSTPIEVVNHDDMMLELDQPGSPMQNGNKEDFIPESIGHNTTIMDVNHDGSIPESPCLSSPIISTQAKRKIGFLGCSAPAGAGFGYGLDLDLFQKLHSLSKLYAFEYIKSKDWMRWKPRDYQPNLKMFDAVVVWASLQDACAEISITTSAHDEWVDILYKSHQAIIPSKKVMQWETSKSYLEDMIEYALPGTEFLKTPQLHVRQGQTYHLKAPLACAGRLHHVASVENKMATEQYLNKIFNTLHRGYCLKQPHLAKFKETKRIITDVQDGEPLAAAVWKKAEELGMRLGWFRLDLVTHSDHSYLNEITRFNPHFSSSETGRIANATLQLINEAIDGSHKDLQSNISLETFMFQKEITSGGINLRPRPTSARQVFGIGLENPGSNYCYINATLQCLFSIIGKDIIASAADGHFLTAIVPFFKNMIQSLETQSKTPLVITEEILGLFSHDGHQKDPTESVINVFPIDKLTMFNFCHVYKWSVSPQHEFQPSEDLTEEEAKQEYNVEDMLVDSRIETNLSLILKIDWEKYSQFKYPIDLTSIIGDYFDDIFIERSFSLTPTSKTLGKQWFERRTLISGDLPECLMLSLSMYRVDPDALSQGLYIQRRKMLSQGIYIPSILSFNGIKYMLHGVLMHVGGKTTDEGHYVAYVRSYLDINMWLLINDKKVTRLEQEPFMCDKTRCNGNAYSSRRYIPYCVFYKRCDFMEQPKKVVQDSSNDEVISISSDDESDEVSINWNRIAAFHNNSLDDANTNQNTVLNKWARWFANQPAQWMDTIDTYYKRFKCHNSKNARPVFMGNQNMRESSILSLEGTRWITDEVMNFFMDMFNELFHDSKCWNSFMYTLFTRCEVTTKESRIDYSRAKQMLEAWREKGVDYISWKGKMVIPLNWDSTLWTFIGVDFEMKTISRMDGMRKDHEHVCNNVLDILQANYMDRFGKQLDRSVWEIRHTYPNYPQQQDGHSCGMYVILGTLAFLRGETLNTASFADADMWYVRLILAYFLIINVKPTEFPKVLY